MRTVVTALGLAAVLFAGLIAPRSAAASGAGTNTVNAASATYADAASRRYSTSSNIVVATIAQLSAIVVNPKELAANPAADSVPAGSPAVRTFTITNTSNIPDAYQLDQLTAGTLSITGAQWLTASGPVPTGINGSISPTIAPGASIAVQVTIATTGLAIGQAVSVVLDAHTTVTGTANGIVHDNGKQWIVAAAGPALTGPGGSNTQIAKSVNAVALVQSQPGNTVTFSIALMNSGGSAATNVVVTDPVPVGLTIVATSPQINGVAAGAQASINGQTIAFTIPTLAAGASLTVSFDATLPPGAVLGASFLNVASVSAQGLAAQQTSPATVLAGLANVVYDGFGGDAARIGGATVTLYDASGHIVKLAGSALSAGSSVARLPQGLSAVFGNTANPYVTGSDGSYGFALTGAQVGTGGRYYLTIAAAGYLNRKIALDITPGAQGLFYDVTQSSEDGQPLAMAGAFTLTRQNVSLNDIFGVFGNLPLFAQRTIVVTKTVDKQAASAGDALSFKITFENQSQYAIGSTTVVDTMPAGMVYIRGSARLDGSPLEPVVAGRNLTWTITALPSGAAHTITYAATIVGSVAPGTNLTNSVTASGTIPSTAATASGNANVTVLVLDGPLSVRRIVTGRVFVDTAHKGHFMRGDRVLGGVRVVMEDGSYAITDAQGEFNFPSVRPGEHVLRLDPLTLPGSVKLDPDVPLNSPHATQRLLHGVLDDATMDDVQFALEPRS